MKNKLQNLKKELNGYIEMDQLKNMDWSELKEFNDTGFLKRVGMTATELYEALKAIQKELQGGDRPLEIGDIVKSNSPHFTGTKVEHKAYWIARDMGPTVHLQEVDGDGWMIEGKLHLERVKYRGRDTGTYMTENDMRRLYEGYIAEGLIDDHGYEDFKDGATCPATGAYEELA